MSSACGSFLAITETSDNSVSLWDIRRMGGSNGGDGGGSALLRYAHTAPNRSDAMMGIAWLQDGRLATGGMDGIVRILPASLSRGDGDDRGGQCTAIPVGSPINCLAFATGDTMLWVGTDFGNVHCFSQNPSIAHAFATKYITHY